MRVKQFLTGSFLSLILLVSCSKKSDDVSKVISIEGVWTGKYSVLSGPYDAYYSFKIKAGGTMELLDAAHQKKGEGVWELENGTIFSATFTDLSSGNTVYSVIANFKKDSGTLDGTWGNGEKEYGGGYWYMDKEN